MKYTVLLYGKLAAMFEIRTGVQQKLCLSPFCFLLLSLDWIMKTTITRNEILWTLTEQLYNLDFPDNTALLFHTKC